jgi:hypothetical protein
MRMAHNGQRSSIRTVDEFRKCESEWLQAVVPEGFTKQFNWDGFTEYLQVTQFALLSPCQDSEWVMGNSDACLCIVAYKIEKDTALCLVDKAG